MTRIETLGQFRPGDSGAVLSARAVMAQSSSENFPVAAWFVPKRARRDLLALYGFARLVDDAGDEVPGDRSAQLDWVEAELDRVFGVRQGPPEHACMLRLATTVREHNLPREPFDRLVAANRQDQVVTSYARFDDLVAYCHLSADPVGELVLRTLGLATAGRLQRSDQVCTALQLIEHCQDVREDYQARAVYLPLDDFERFGCALTDLAAAQTGEPLRRAVAFMIGQVEPMLTSGGALVGMLNGWPRAAVAGFVAGGWAAIDGLRGCGFDVLADVPRPRRSDLLRHWLQLAAPGRSGRRWRA